MAFLLKRNASVICSSVESGFTLSNTARLNIVDETFSYSQSSTTQDASRDEIRGSDRGTHFYTSSINPATFSFSTYLSSSTGILPDELLWEALSNDSITGLSTIDFAASNVTQLPEIFIWIDHAGTTYKLTGAILEQASISLNLEGLPIVTWSGKARLLEAGTAPVTYTDHSGFIPEAISKLTTITFERNTDSKAYTLVLTGYSLDINNNVNWVGRDRIGEISRAETHYLGNRSFSGNLNMYLKTGTSKILLDDVLTGLNADTEHTYTTTINIGGAVNNCVLYMPNLIINAPETDIDEVVALSVPYKATEATKGTGDELTITFN